MKIHDPYEGNILIQNLGSIKSRNEISKSLTFLPKFPPEDIENIPKHIRMHLLQDVRDLHIPSLIESRQAESLDLMLRQSYKYRDPKLSSTWSKLYSPSSDLIKTPAPPMAMGITGLPGVGKTQSIRKSLLSYPQIITHENFPGFVSQFNQVVWISVDVPSSGKSEHLAMNLMNAWDEIFTTHFESYLPRFAESLERNKLDGPRMLDHWRKVAATHFLGVLHLDEAQNLFSIPTLKKRNSGKNLSDAPLKLSIREDTCLKWILSLTNTWNIALILSCTPDGINAFKSRFSNLQRFISYGLHSLKRFSIDDVEFNEVFLPWLMRYQYVKNKITDKSELGKVLIKLSGGIQRIIIALWIAAHRVAFERKQTDELLLEDFIEAAKSYLSPIAPAIKALNTGEPAQISAYEDMIGDEGFWDAFWNSVDL